MSRTTNWGAIHQADVNARAVARAEKAVVRAAVALRKARYQHRDRKDWMTHLWNLDFRAPIKDGARNDHHLRILQWL